MTNTAQDHNTPLGKVLVIGSGGREHAIVKACLASPLVTSTIAAPGNGGIASECPCYPLDVENCEQTVALAKEQNVDFVIVGPEAPLCAGAVDALAQAGIPAYGPNKQAAQLEGSKAFTKDFLFRHNIPTGASETFTETQPALAYLDKINTYPIVIKASGLAAGKGVIIAETRDHAVETIQGMLDQNTFGESGSSLLIEEYLEGEEASITVMASGTDYIILPPSQDHKRAHEGDTGPNTGGMGAYAPAAVVTPELADTIEQTLVKASLEGLAKDGIDFRGTLYVGAMLTKDGPKVLEFNVRFGDPETQVLLPLLETDPIALMRDCALKQLKPAQVKVRNEYAMVIVLAAKGYPGSYPKGDPITLPDTTPPNGAIIHAGTKRLDDGTIVTSGGRVLGVTSTGTTLQAAADAAYALCQQIKFDGMHYRRDIGHRQLARE